MTRVAQAEPYYPKTTVMGESVIGMGDIPSPPVVVTEQIIVQVAVELAKGLYEPRQVIDKFGLTFAQFKGFCSTLAFRGMFTDAKAAWLNTKNSTERIRAKSNMLIEDLILMLYERAKDPKTTDEACVKIMKQIVEVSNIAPTKDTSDVDANKFTIEIHINNDDRTIVGAATAKHVPLALDG